MKLRRSTRPFSLIEVLVALAIVSACAVPLMRPHFTLAKNEAQAMARIEFELKAKKAFEEVRERLYKQPWWHGNATPPRGTIGEATYTITVPNNKDKGKGRHRRTYRLLNVAITIDGETANYTLVAEKVRE